MFAKALPIVYIDSYQHERMLADYKSNFHKLLHCLALPLVTIAENGVIMYTNVHNNLG